MTDLDIDECDTVKKDVCPGRCINTPGEYRCDCDIPGYRPSAKKYFCRDVNECKKENGGCDDSCENTRGSYTCRCNQKGWKLGHDNHTCVDVNECERYGKKICLHGECINLIGDYRCVCEPGYYVGPGERFCEDIDECDVNNGGCDDQCVNTDGSYHCNCTQEGLTMTSNGFNCKDIDECKIDNGGCEARCINIPGSYRCSCPAFGEVVADDRRSCHACGNDEFYNRRRKKCIKCPENSQKKSSLARTALSAEDCECNPGFEGNPAMFVPCVDINECERYQVKCEFSCVNTIGGAHCECPRGFFWDAEDEICKDTDECLINNGGCSHDCINYAASYRCSCPGDGFKLADDDHTCQDINECISDLVTCDYGCENTIGGYRCVCPTGYQLNNKTNLCDDINECEWEDPPCNQSCTNIPGSFLCNCDSAGFKLSWDNSACIDINECMEGENPCGESCQNTIGSFKCECNKNGYSSSSDGLKCADINECEYNHTTVCDHLCTNLPGSYKCSCHPGYRKLGATKCAPCPKGYYRGVRDKVCKSCPTHATTAEEGAISVVECLCKPGFKGDPGRQLKCKDINECTEEDNYGCSHRCTNAVGSAYCGCKEGFRLDSDHKTCIDVDECKISNGGCQQICYNTPGSFGCDCRTPHYSLARNGKSCRDVNECLNNQHTCSHQCVNIRDGYRCACHTGYGLEYDNKTCSDIDECERDNGRCTDKCVNTLGSYTCECTQPGLTLYGDGKQCVDRNECLEDNPCQDKCENTHGSYRCVCSSGNYNLSADSHTCSDLDECASNFTNACDQVCINLPGSYRCSCHAGYYRAGSACVACRKNTYRDSSMPITSCERCPPRSETEGTAAASLLECKCPKGFERKTPKSQVCTDIDECSKENKNISGCSHSCYNLPGRYFCSCPRGSRLQTDRKTCYGSNNCKPLEKPKKGIVWPPECLGVGIKKLTPGVACSVRCHHGYRLTGSRIRTCAANGKFSGTSGTCKVIKCRGLNTIANGRLHPPKCRGKSVPFGKRCRVRCHPGYKLVGRIGTKCRATGRWSHRLRTSCVAETTRV